MSNDHPIHRHAQTSDPVRGGGLDRARSGEDAAAIRRRRQIRSRWVSRLAWLSASAAFAAFFALWANAGGVWNRIQAAPTTNGSAVDTGDPASAAAAPSDGRSAGGTDSAASGSGTVTGGDAYGASGDWGRHHHRGFAGVGGSASDSGMNGSANGGFGGAGLGPGGSVDGRTGAS